MPQTWGAAAFARPRPAQHAQETKAYIVGSGLAGLAAAVFLIRDAGVPGANVTILEKDDIAGGALDGLDVPEKGFVIRGGRGWRTTWSACGT